MLGRMYFAANDPSQIILVLALMLSSLILDGNKEATNWISSGISSGKNEPFNTGLATAISDVAKGRVILKCNNSILVQKGFLQSIVTLF